MGRAVERGCCGRFAGRGCAGGGSTYGTTAALVREGRQGIRSLRQVATVGGRKLDLTRPGAVLFLTTEARRDWVEILQGGVSVQVHEGSTSATVGGFDPLSTLDQVCEDARQRVNEALDLMAVRSLGAHALTDAVSPTISWALSGGTTVMRTTSDLHGTFGASFGGPPNPGPSAWHPCMRYFRLSQTTTDLFDAFRNLYLAIESLLSEIEPVKVNRNGKPGESESAWVERALGAAEQRLLRHNSALTLGQYLAPPTSETGQVAVTQVKADLYAGARTKVFHAKSGRPVAIPQHDPDRDSIADALTRYAWFFTELAEAVLGTRFLRSGLAPAGFDSMVDGVLPKLTVVAASSTVATVEEFEAAPREALLRLPTRRAPEFDAPFEAAVRGTLEAASVPVGFVVTALGSVLGEEPASSFDALGAPLTLEGVDVWEHILTFRIYSQGFKASYSS